jgi:hypothetical protein
MAPEKRYLIREFVMEWRVLWDFTIDFGSGFRPFLFQLFFSSQFMFDRRKDI